jgi:mRNA-degrading endonuclease RelE of RelBE toxin-antitoxin system
MRTNKMTDKYRVAWSNVASRELSKLYNIDPRKVFLKSKYLLSQLPHKKAYNIINDPELDIDGYYWILINNVVIIYRVDEIQKRVLIDAVYFANTKESAQMFWGIEPDEE